jgi:hypothetical protein
MSTTKYTDNILNLLADDKMPDFLKQGKQYISEIETDMDDLQRQLAIIKKLVSRFDGATKATSNDQIKPKRRNQKNPSLTPEQKQHIVESVHQLILKNPNRSIDASEIITDLESKGITLLVDKPNSVIASVLKKDTTITKPGKNKYKGV